MVVFIILLVIFLILTGAMVVDEWQYGDGFSAVCLGLFTSMCSFVFAGLLSMMFGSFLDDQWETYDKGVVEIVSLEDNSSIHGSFFLGSGVIDGTMKYYGYERVNGESYKMVMFNMDDVTIVEDIKDGDTPYYTIQHERDVRKSVWVFIDSGDRHVNTEIHIPKGSIQQGFNLNSK